MANEIISYLDMCLHQELFQFISKRMKMSHIYQSQILITLLKNGGQNDAAFNSRT